MYGGWDVNVDIPYLYSVHQVWDDTSSNQGLYFTD